MLNPDLLTFLDQGQVVGCCLLVWRTQWVRGIPLRRVYLNSAGENDEDATCIEYNDLLALPAYAAAVAQALGDFLKRQPWDEFILPGMVANAPFCVVARSLGKGEWEDRPSHYMDLAKVRSQGAGLDTALSSNSRQQIRRAQRLYEAENGACRLHVAHTLEEAQGILRRLADLHQVAWQDRGRSGVFASASFLDFHQKLIHDQFAHGRILLLEMLAGDLVIGALYGFMDERRLYFYQSGFRYHNDGRLKPGLLTHYLAMGHCLHETALQHYDFLAGDSQYKRSLSSGHHVMCWVTVRRKTVPVLVFLALRCIKRQIKRGRAKAPQKALPQPPQETPATDAVQP